MPAHRQGVALQIGKAKPVIPERIGMTDRFARAALEPVSLMGACYAGIGDIVVTARRALERKEGVRANHGGRQ